MTPDPEELLRVIRPMLKGHLRQTRTLLALLSQLEETLNPEPIAQPGGTANNGNDEEYAAAER